MKRTTFFIITFIFCCLSSITIQAQDGRDYKHEDRKERMQKIQTAKIAFITEKLNLTTEEAQKFWPVYNQLEEERRGIRHKSRGLRDDKIASLSDQQIREALNQRLALQQAEVNIDKNYMEKFLKVISPRQLATFYRAEKEFTDILLKKLDMQRTAANK